MYSRNDAAKARQAIAEQAANQQRITASVAKSFTDLSRAGQAHVDRLAGDGLIKGTK